MRGKHLNSGIRGGLWDEAHLARMGPAVWLFGWLVHRQTRERNGVGLVLGGSPLTYAKISEDTGMAVRTLKRWMARLNAEGYIRVKHTVYKRMIIQICKAKKFGAHQLAFPQASFFPQNSQGPLPAREPGSKGPNAAYPRNTYRELSTERHISRNMHGGNVHERDEFLPKEKFPSEPKNQKLLLSQEAADREPRTQRKCEQTSARARRAQGNYSPRRESGHCACEECRRRDAALQKHARGEFYRRAAPHVPDSRPLTAWERREEETRRELMVGMGPEIEWQK